MRKLQSKWVFFFWLAFATTLQLVCSDDEKKELPDKGDAGCLSLEERQELSNNGDESVWFNPCDQVTTPIDIPVNGIMLPVFVAAPAYSWSFDVPVAFLVISYLNTDLSPQYYIHMPSIGLESIISQPTIEPTHKTIADIKLIDIQTANIQQTRKSIWRRYRLVFECTWGNVTDKIQGSPMTNPILLDRIRGDMERSLHEFVDVASIFEFYKISNGTIAMGADDPRDVPFEYQTVGNWSVSTPAPTPGPTMSLREQGTFDVPVRMRDWNWQQSFGLWMFLITVALAVIITHLAGLRQRHYRSTDLWATAEGVEYLLDKTRWKLTEGDKTITSPPPTAGASRQESELLQQIIEEEHFESEEFI